MGPAAAGAAAAGREEAVGAASTAGAGESDSKETLQRAVYLVTSAGVLGTKGN